MEALRQHTGDLIGNESRTSLVKMPTLLSANPSTSSMSLTLGRTQLNIHKICKNARLYREDCYSFNQLANEVEGTNQHDWACNHCNMVMSKISLRLAPNSPDVIWIAPVGLFKAHCRRFDGEQDGLTCIWPVVDGSCHVRFGNELQLLQHMRRHHVIPGVASRSFKLHWPADLRTPSAKTCGFGATVGGHEMEDRNFIIPER
jgi:hypothetical protein